MPTGIDLKGAKQASGVAKRPKAAGKMAEGVVCKGGQIWDQRLGKCVDAKMKKAAQVLKSAPIPNK